MKLFYIASKERETEFLCWWKPDGHGYTYDLSEAGKYSAADAFEIVGDSGGGEAFYSCEKIDSLGRLTVPRSLLLGAGLQ